MIASGCVGYSAIGGIPSEKRGDDAIGKRKRWCPLQIISLDYYVTEAFSFFKIVDSL